MRPLLETIPMLALDPIIAGALRSTVLIAIAALAVLALRRGSASWRHLIWTLALLGCVAMPLATSALPGWFLPAIPGWSLVPAAPAGEAAAVMGAAVDPHRASRLVTAAAPIERRGAVAAASAPVGTRSSAPTTWTQVLRGMGLPRIAALLWLAGALLMGGRYLLAWRSLSHRTRRSTLLTDSRWQRALARNGAAIGLPRLPECRISSAITVPMVWNAWRPTILLPAEALGWTDGRCDSVLLHEMAHVHRFDLLAAHAAQLAIMVAWFNPLVWVAVRRQRAEAERACDDLVLIAGGRASAYASDLLEIARGMGDRERFHAAALAMARRSQLEGRLLAILDPRRPRRAAGRVALSFSVLVAAAIVSFVAAARPAQGRPGRPAPPPTRAAATAVHPTAATRSTAGAETPPSPADAETSSAQDDSPPRPGAIATITVTHEGGVAETESAADADSDAPAPPDANGEGDLAAATGTHSHWSVQDDGKGEVRTGSWSVKDSRGSFKSKGTVRYSDDLHDITSISDGGYVEIEHRRGGVRREAELRGRAGRIERTYRVNGVARAWDDEARAWLAQYLIELDRGSGAFVEQRYPRLMKEGGPERVLKEISQLESDYARAVYFSHLLNADLDAPALRRAVMQAGREIDSDYELARTLVAATGRHALDDPGTRSAYLEAIAGIESDYEHARVLMVLVARRDLSADLADGAMGSAARISSDYEQARVLIAMVERGHVKAPQQRGFIRVAQAIASDYEKSRVLRTLLQRADLSGESLDAMLAASATLHSDYERANVLVDLAESVPLDGADRAAFVSSAEGISSSYERNRALAALSRPSGR